MSLESVTHVLNNVRLQQVLDEISTVEKQLQDVVDHMHSKAFGLVWYARHHNEEQRIFRVNKLGPDYTADIAVIDGEDGDYYHGLYTGILGVDRLAHELSNAVEHVEDCLGDDTFAEVWETHVRSAIINYPELDT